MTRIFIVFALLLAGCGHAPWGTHSLGTSPFPELKGLNEASNGWRPLRPESGEGYHGKRPKPPTPPPRPHPSPDDEWCCRATIGCSFPDSQTREYRLATVGGFARCAESRGGAQMDALDSAFEMCGKIKGQYEPRTSEFNCWELERPW